MLLFADHDDEAIEGARAGALSSAPLAALYHVNAKFSRYEHATDLDALIRPGGDGDDETSLFDGLPRIPVESSPDALHMSLRTAIQRRRSVRRFAGTPISSWALGTLLQFSAGIVDASPTPGGRATPSGGAKYPVQLVACVSSVGDISPGIYGYDVRTPGLVPLRVGASSYDEVKGACFYPDVIEGAAVVILLVAVLRRSTRRYREQGYRLAVQEAGHIAQNLTLVSTALGLGSIVLAGFDEQDVEGLLGLDGQAETLLSTVLVGQLPSEPEGR